MKEREMKPKGYAVGPHATGWYSPEILFPADQRMTISDEDQKPVDSLAFQQMILEGLRRAESEANAEPATTTAELDVVDHPQARAISIPAATAERVLRDTMNIEDSLSEVGVSLHALRGIIARAAPAPTEAPGIGVTAKPSRTRKK